MDQQLIFGVSDFVAYLNQTLETAYPQVVIEGELSNFRVSKNRWIYFDLKDEGASVRFFGTVYALPGPLENGMVVRVSGSPHLHPQYNFSVTVESIAPIGQGSIRRAADLLQAKLAAEGLFDAERKRALPYPPKHIALITAGSSAAYADFIKILHARWRGVTIEHFDVLVQGERAPEQIVAAIKAANALADLPEVLVLTRGGGSVEDLAAFNTEAVTRAVATSRLPTLVAIGHEVDLSLSELAADQRASTPSNAAELLTPDRRDTFGQLAVLRQNLDGAVLHLVNQRLDGLRVARKELDSGLEQVYQTARQHLRASRQLLEAYNPTAALQRGYAVVRVAGNIIKSVGQVKLGMKLEVALSDGTIMATITDKEQSSGQTSK